MLEKVPTKFVSALSFTSGDANHARARPYCIERIRRKMFWHLYTNAKIETKKKIA